MIRLNAKLFCCSTFLFLGVQLSFGQSLLTIEELDTVKIFNSVEDAISNPDEVIRLELKKKKYTEIPVEIFQFKNLQYLDLSKNKLDTFPEQLGQLKNLRVLILNRNELNYLTETIGELENLLVLQVNNNYLWEIDPAIGNLTQLEILDIWANRLVILPETIQDIATLQELDMRVNPVKREEQEEIQGYIPNCLMHFSYDCKCY